MKGIFIWGIFCVFALTAGAAPSNPAMAAHRYHASLTRIDFNAETQTAEITIQLFIHDLVPVIERQYKRKLEPEDSATADPLILDYLRSTFILKNKAGDAGEIKWVGKELEVEKAFIHLEIPMPGGIEGASLQNTIFFETFVEQTNRVNIHSGKKSATLTYLPGNKPKTITFRAAGKVEPFRK